MKREEAMTICNIMTGAHGGCENCVEGLLDEFESEFPEHKEIVSEVLEAFREKMRVDFGKVVAEFRKKKAQEGEGNGR